MKMLYKYWIEDLGDEDAAFFEAHVIAPDGVEHSACSRLRSRALHMAMALHGMPDEATLDEFGGESLPIRPVGYGV